MSRRQIRRQGDRPPGRQNRRVIQAANLTGRGVLTGDRHQGLGPRRVRGREIGVGRDGGVEPRQRGAIGSLARVEVQLRPTLEKGVIGRHAGRAAQTRLHRRHLRRHGLGDGVGNLALHGEHVGELAVEAVGPSTETGAPVHQLGGDAHRVAGAAHAALQQKGDAELGGDGDRALGRIARGVRRGGGEDLQLAVARQRQAHLFGQAVGEIALRRIAAQIAKRQHGDAVGRRGREQAGPPGDIAPATHDRRQADAAAGDQQPAPRSPKGGGRRTPDGRLAARRHGHGAHQVVDLKRVGAPAPVRQRDGVILAKAQRRLRPVERHRHETAAIARMSRLVAHPVGGDRRRRPDHDHRVGLVEGGFDGPREGRAALDQDIPPHLVAGRLQPRDDLRHARPVDAGVADEDVRSSALARLPPNAGHRFGSLEPRRGPIEHQDASTPSRKGRAARANDRLRGPRPSDSRRPPLKTGPGGGVVTQRTANPCTRVRISARPPNPETSTAP